MTCGCNSSSCHGSCYNDYRLKACCEPGCFRKMKLFDEVCCETPQQNCHSNNYPSKPITSGCGSCKVKEPKTECCDLNAICTKLDILNCKFEVFEDQLEQLTDKIDVLREILLDIVVPELYDLLYCVC